MIKLYEDWNRRVTDKNCTNSNDDASNNSNNNDNDDDKEEHGKNSKKKKKKITPVTRTSSKWDSRNGNKNKAIINNSQTE